MHATLNFIILINLKLIMIYNILFFFRSGHCDTNNDDDSNSDDQLIDFDYKI